MSKFALSAIPIAFVVLGFGLGSQEFHWDTLERAVILENPSGFLRSWDGSPRSQFLSFAHVLELPMASLLRLGIGSPSGLQALVAFELLCAAAALLLLGLLVRQRGASRLGAVAAQAALACCWGFWKMGTSGEERILSMATLLLFLWTLWTLLQTGRRALLVSICLMVAVLAHLSNAVLLPFAFLGLLLLPPTDRTYRRRTAVALLFGAALCATTYALVAAFTTGVRTLPQFWQYLTFFHRDTGNDFFSVSLSGDTWKQSWDGMRHFLSEASWVGTLTFVLLLAVPLRAVWRRGWSGMEMQDRHLLLLAILWALHFAFYEPANIESWTVIGVALILGATWALPRKRQPLILGALALLLLISNMGSFRQLHKPMELQLFLEQVQAASAPDDIILMGGGIQKDKPLRGGHATRYFLAHERQRTIVSLYDVMQITQREFWGRPIASLEQLQNAIDSGHRVWFPSFLLQEFETARDSGLVQLQFRAHGDRLYEVTAVSAPPR